MGLSFNTNLFSNIKSGFENAVKSLETAVSNAQAANYASGGGGSTIALSDQTAAQSGSKQIDVEKQTKEISDYLNEHGCGSASLEALNSKLLSSGVGKIGSENGNIYYTVNGQSYLVGGDSYNKMNFYNKLAAGGANSPIMSAANEAQQKLDSYVEELAERRSQPDEEIFKAELLLNQVTIMNTQAEQDEVLAEILLNQMEV